VTRPSRAPTYREVADDLAQRIESGEYPPGSGLPERTELARSYGVSVSTLARALMLLRDRGLVLGVPGRGVFVIGRPR
jgi:DNA-binding GntR family transcriptional regulator